MPASAPIVTMIVPGRDVAAFAPHAIHSLLGQTESRWRAILIDDGSMDATGAVFEDAAATDDRFVVIRHPTPLGLGAARNTGLDLVDSPVVGFLDADDELTPTALARMTGVLQSTGSDFVAGAYVRLRPHGTSYTAGRVQPWVASATDPERRRTTILEHPAAAANIVAWSKLSRRELWDDMRFPIGVAYEDQLVAQQMYTRASAFDVIPDVVVRWRVRPDGSSITQGKARLPVLRDYLRALRGGIDVLKDAGASDAVVGRISLILAMDLPSLSTIAATHPDPEYARELDRFLTDLRALPEFDRATPDPTLTAALSW